MSSTVLLAVAFVIGVWWLSTALTLRLVWSPARHFRAIFAAASAAGLASVVGVIGSAARPGVAGAYVGFVSAIGVWGWHELSFLLGVVTGPRRSPCPATKSLGRRFLLATSTVIHHEVALAATAVVLVAATWGQPNQVGVQTFLVLWVMRVSAKLNVFLGVRNLAEDFVPAHLTYLCSYFRRDRRLNALMPFCLAGGAWAIWRAALAASEVQHDPARLTEATLLAAILLLGVVEHVFLVLPLPDAQLFRWAIRSRLAQRNEASNICFDGRR